MQSSEPTDSELLADWSSRQREPAFRQLVARYAGLVHMAAKRTCGDDSLAAEASQLTFILLAQKGKSLTSRQSLAGWLHLTAVMQAKNLLRKSCGELRKRDQLHAAMEAEPHSTDDSWKEMQPVLDDALAALSEKDREALLLHFYRSLSAREIAETLGIATDAARKRIDRATEKLRAKLAIRGCSVGGSLSVVMLAGFAAEAKASAATISLITANATAAAVPAATFSLPTLIAMKKMTLLPPALALMVAGAWIFPQREAIAKLEKLNDAAATSAVHPAANSQKSAVRPRRVANSKGGSKEIDWERVAFQEEDNLINGRMQSRSSVDDNALREKLNAMSPEELLTELDRITALELFPDAKRSLERNIGFILARKDPAFALDHLEGRLGERSDFRFVLAEALKLFAKNHPDEAAAWLDRQIAAGRLETTRLDRKNRTRNNFHAVLISNLLVSDPDAASRRLAAISSDERKAVLGSMAVNRLTKADEQIAHAKLMREHLTTKEQLSVMGSVAWTLQDHLSNVDAYLDRISATPEERKFTVEQAVIGKIHNTAINRKLTAAELKPTLEWIEKHNPEEADRIFGKALGWDRLGSGHSNLTEITEIVIHLHEAGRNDDLIEGFASSDAVRKQPELARSLASGIIDENRRAEMLKTPESSEP
ncbi:MAG: RNA polymerase sigma factor [Verrucomicrobiota bacterium]